VADEKEVVEPEVLHECAHVSAERFGPVLAIVGPPRVAVSALVDRQAVVVLSQA